MVRLSVNGIEVEVGEGATLLDAAQRAGVEVPTLCYEKAIGALTSCMICVVKDQVSGRMLPACSAKAFEGMAIDTECEKVRVARREILNMLLSEHVGDCEGPCSRICPAALNIPRMLRYIAAGDVRAAAGIAKRDLIFPATLGRLCTAPCERGCRRASYDAPVSIRSLHGEMAEQCLNDSVERYMRAPRTGKAVAIVGAGLAGLSAAWMCGVAGHACRVYEKRASACASLCGQAAGQLPREILDAEIGSVCDLGAELVLDCEVGVDPSIESLLASFDAVIVACDVVSSSDARIFRAREDEMPVRAVANGKTAGRLANAVVEGLPNHAAAKPFNSRIGGLRPEEMEAYAVERLQWRGSATSELDTPGARASRCLHCDCLKPTSCKLRRYAEEYGIGTKLKRRMERPRVLPIQRFDDVLFESGKCIKCGICVEITRAAGMDFGLTFAGRGLESRVQVPFGESLARGLGDVAPECMRACPTGALAFRNAEETA